ERHLAELDEGQIARRAREVLLVVEDLEARAPGHGRSGRRLREEVALGVQLAALAGRIDAQAEGAAVVELVLGLDGRAVLGLGPGEAVGHARGRAEDDGRVVAELRLPRVAGAVGVAARAEVAALAVAVPAVLLAVVAARAVGLALGESTDGVLGDAGLLRDRR